MCDHNSEENKIHQLLIFKREELMFHVVNKLHIIKEKLESENPGISPIIEDIDDEHYGDEATRSANLAYQEAVDAVYSLTKVPVEHDGTLDNTYGEPRSYVMAMKLPADFSKGTVALLKNLIHDFIVARVIEDWFKLVLPERVDEWRIEGDRLKSKISEALSKRVHGMERPYYIF